ncbi:c-type cytochrome biogenesis protein CcsB [Lampropedia aestuarii]|uniref:c-type cytochrome biogenesis protein CcsB n=1 Tax=Lampropedia aestuarii TaxID=2562762 RepID=UPI0024697A9D|nr:c-type cytochrome biogenesis protein CcsB [Lampropedia aestuarii]MDH5856049.1 c-type cytochrome biogenesis protein CcsB [Lampropedia aestuarii]
MNQPPVRRHIPAAPVPASTPRRACVRPWTDYGFAAVVALACLVALLGLPAHMDVYEQAIAIGAALALIAVGWYWRPLQWFSISAALLAALAIGLYQGPVGADLARAQTQFVLKYALSSQAAILWMCVLYVLSTVFYWLGLLSPRSPHSLAGLGSRLAWAASTLALAGTLVRWYESYLLGADIGYIPISNLYEVFVLFCWVTALFYLYYEQRYQTRSLGGFVMLLVSAAVGFLLWYVVARQGQVIEPLVPALQSWWMKVHVPANFIGYGCFAIAAMVAFAWLLQHYAQAGRWWQLAPLWLLGLILCLEPWLLRSAGPQGSGLAVSPYWMVYGGVVILLVSLLVALRKPLAQQLPSTAVLDDWMYKTIAMGFAFFTIATVLGALWAAEAWGGYWSWDPKESWALIVWLNYAAWLHMRLIKGMRGAWLAWWAVLGLVVTTFAFVGVNLFLSGLHSYGEL